MISVICAERLSEELEDYHGLLEKDKKLRVDRLQNIFLLIEQVYSSMEKELEERMDRTVLQQSSKLKSR